MYGPIIYTSENLRWIRWNAKEFQGKLKEFEKANKNPVCVCVWERGEMGILTSLALIIVKKNPQQQQSLSRIWRFLSNKRSGELISNFSSFLRPLTKEATRPVKRQMVDISAGLAEKGRLWEACQQVLWGEMRSGTNLLNGIANQQLKIKHLDLKKQRV